MPVILNGKHGVNRRILTDSYKGGRHRVFQRKLPLAFFSREQGWAPLAILALRAAARRCVFTLAADGHGARPFFVRRLASITAKRLAPWDEPQSRNSPNRWRWRASRRGDNLHLPVGLYRTRAPTRRLGGMWGGLPGRQWPAGEEGRPTTNASLILSRAQYKANARSFDGWRSRAERSLPKTHVRRQKSRGVKAKKHDLYAPRNDKPPRCTKTAKTPARGRKRRSR